MGTTQLADRREIGNSFLSKDCQIVIEKYNIAEEDAKSLKTFFDKYWSKFEKATSTLVVFPKACLYETSYCLFEYLKERFNNIREGFVDISDIEGKLKGYVEKMRKKNKYKYAGLIDQK